MVVSVVLKSRTTEQSYLGIDERIKRRISFGIQIARFYGAYFKPRSIEVWKYAPLKELEGILLREIKIERGFVSKEEEDVFFQRFQTLDLVDRYLSVIRILGAWNANDLSLHAYLTISNNPNWRRIYGDVEVNVFPERGIRDVVDLLYEDKAKKKELVDNFLTEFASYADEAYDVSAIYFTLGIAAPEDLDLWRTVSLNSKNTFLQNSIARLKAIGGDEIEHALGPYSVPFLVKSLRGVPQFDAYLNKSFVKHQIIEKPVGSVGFIGETPDSFKDFFEEFAETVLKPMLRNLPQDTEISSKIRNAIQKQTTLE